MGEKIQRPPTGLLSLLNIVGSGQTQRTLLEDVRPIIDAEQFYLGNQWENFGTSSTAQTKGTSLALTVPSGEYWIVAGASYTIEALAGESVTAFVSWRVNPSGSVMVGNVNDTLAGVVALADYSCRVGMGSLRSVLAPGGAILGTISSSTLAAARACNLFATIVRLRF